MLSKESKNEVVIKEKKKENKNSNPYARFSDNVTVSNYGFLIFPSPGDFGEYWEFVISSTHEEVQDYLDSIGFTSPGATLYGEEYWDDRVSEEEGINYLFNEDQIFQIRNVVMKPINAVNKEVKWEFFLTMTSDNLSTANYESLASGIYDGSIMNQFATNPYDETLDLFGFIGHTPSGYQETTANSSTAGRPMFGSRTTCTNVQGGCFNAQTNHNDPCSFVNTKKYVFLDKSF